MVRDQIFAQVFGAGGDFDVFLIAFKIPQFLRRVFAEGAFSQAFIPVLKAHEKQSPKAFAAYLNQVFTFLVCITALIAYLVLQWPHLCIGVFAPGLLHDPERYALAIKMIQIIFPSVMLIAMGGFLQAALNAKHEFTVPAMTPVMQNLVFIIASLGFTAYFQPAVFAMVWGVLVASVLQVLWMLVAYLRRYPRLFFSFQWSPGLVRTIALMGVGVYATSVNQIGVLIDSILFSWLPAGSLSWFYFSERLCYLPQGLFGVAIATVLSPSLAATYQSSDHDAFDAKVNWGLNISGLLGVPCAIGLYWFAGPIVTVVFKSGKFSWHDVEQTATAVRCLAFGIPAFLWSKVLSGAFYARQEIKIPAWSATLSLGVNLMVSLSLLTRWQHAAMASAIAVAAYVNVVFLWVAFYQGRCVESLMRQGMMIGKVLLASLSIIGVGLLGPSLLTWSAYSYLWQCLSLGGMMLTGGVVYLFILRRMVVSWRGLILID